MTLTVDISDDLTDVLKAAFGPDLQRAFVEAIALNLYHEGKLTIPELQDALSLSSASLTAVKPPLPVRQKHRSDDDL